MAVYTNEASLALTEAGDAIDIGFERTSPTSGVISWTIPNPIGVYDGVIVLMKPGSDIGPAELPTDGVRYDGNPNLAVAHTLGDAYIVEAIYGDRITDTVTVVGLDPDTVYFVGGYVADNTLRYDTQGTFAYKQTLTTKAFTGHIKKSATPPPNPLEGMVYFNTSVGMTFFADETGAWNPCVRGRNSLHDSGSTTTSSPALHRQAHEEYNIAYDTGREFPATGGLEAGRFFYHALQGLLFVWTGKRWAQANTEFEGTPTYDVMGVGSDGTSDEFAALAAVIKRKLGWPQLCVELNEADFQIAIEAAVSMLRRRADNAYEARYIMLQAKQGQSLYYLNDPANGTDTIVDVIKITRGGSMGMSMFTQGDLYTQPFVSDFISRGAVDLTTLHMMAEYSEMFERIFAHDIGFRWNESKRQLQLLKVLRADEVILLECSCERTEQELLRDRWFVDWIEDWAMAECKAKLALIRGKYGTLPGPGGGITLNAADLQVQAQETFTELLRQIADYEVGNGTTFGNTGFLIG